VKLPMPTTLQVSRKVLHFCSAAWHNLKRALKHWSWERLKHGSADAATTFTDSLLSLCWNLVPQSSAEVFKSTRPWLNADCPQVIQQKTMPRAQQCLRCVDQLAQPSTKQRIAITFKPWRQKLATPTNRIRGGGN